MSDQDAFKLRMFVLQRQHEHFLKLLDVFETRQTWVFNFAVLVYAGWITAIASFSDKLYVGSAIEPHLLTSVLCVCSILLPILLLPLCFLYVDVSVFCAALDQGNSAYFNRVMDGEEPPRFIGPGRLGFIWLREAGHAGKQSQNYSAGKAEGALNVEWIANSRVAIFYIAPLVGLAASAWAGYLVLHNKELAEHPGLVGSLVVSYIVSSVSLVLTQLACIKTIRARNRAHPLSDS